MNPSPGEPVLSTVEGGAIIEPSTACPRAERRVSAGEC